MQIVKVTAENKMDWLTPLAKMQAFRVGSFLLIDSEGRVRYSGRKSDCIAKAAEIGGAIDAECIIPAWG